MATTWLKAIHKRGGIAAALGRSVDYISDSDKTNEGELIDSYECNLRTAVSEFLMSKREYEHITGRNQGRRDVIAYHMRQSFKPGEITPEEAKAIMDEGNATVLDVRTTAEFEEAHIVGAVLIPDTDIRDMALELLPDKKKTILVYCRTGIRSERATRALIELGYKNVYDFGGIVDWPYETVSGRE